MYHRLRAFLLHYAQGLLMGGADIIPGVSGGTMALIVGIYERLVASISQGYSALAHAIRLDAPKARRHFTAVEWRLVVPLGFGIISAILVASEIIPELLAHYPHQMRGLFFGLVAASIAVPWRRIGRISPTLIGVALTATALAFWLTGLPALETTSNPSYPRVFASAAVAISAMILPGISGAFLLEVLGIYAPTLQALNDRNLLYVGVFVGGLIVGLGLFSKLLNWLLKHYHDRTMAALIGLMAGSLRAIWPYQETDRTLQLPGSGDPVWTVLLLGLLGFTFVTFLTWWGHRRIDSPT